MDSLLSLTGPCGLSVGIVPLTWGNLPMRLSEALLPIMGIALFVAQIEPAHYIGTTE
jgi:hypothetical protein